MCFKTSLLILLFPPYLGYRRDHPSWQWDNCLKSVKLVKLRAFCSHSPLFGSPAIQGSGATQALGKLLKMTNLCLCFSGCFFYGFDPMRFLTMITHHWGNIFLWFFQPPNSRKSKYLVDASQEEAACTDTRFFFFNQSKSTPINLPSWELTDWRWFSCSKGGICYIVPHRVGFGFMTSDAKRSPSQDAIARICAAVKSV